MRRPVLIAETPFANGHGPRFLAAPGRGVDAALAAHYIDRVRDEADDIEEVEGDDYLAVRMTLDDEATGEKAPQLLVLAGIDANNMTAEERDEVLEQLRERLEVLNDAVAAVDWTVQEHEFVIEIPELEEWHEAGWDMLPRVGRWAEDSGESSAAAFRGVDTERPDEKKQETESSSPATDPEPEPELESRTDERIEDAGEPFRFGPADEQVEEKRRDTVALTPSSPEAGGVGSGGEWGEGGLRSRGNESQFRGTSDPPHPRPSPPEAGREGSGTTPAPASIVLKTTNAPNSSAAVTAPAPPSPRPTPPPARIDPVQVSESADRSASLTPLPPKPADSPRTRPMILRWWVWGPWSTVAVLLTANYLYLTRVDKTWNQRVSETHYAAGATKVVQVAADKPAATPDSTQLAWTAFVADFGGKLSRAELAPAADLLHAWSRQMATMSDPLRTELTELQAEFRTVAVTRLQESTAGRCRDRRFADAYDGLAAFAASEPIKAILDAKVVADAVSAARAQVRAAEDEYHYTQICTLAATKPIPEEKLKQHLDAYLALVEPPGRMLAEVQQVADYRKWLKDGRPVKAVVKIEWGKRTVAGEHKIEIGIGATQDRRPLKTFAANTVARPGSVWTETIVVSGIVGPPERIPYRLKAVRPASAIEELAEGVREHAELFGTESKAGGASETGTVVTIDWKGLLDAPVLPTWKDAKAPVLPVSLPKVGP